MTHQTTVAEIIPFPVRSAVRPPFSSAADAWFWAMSCFIASRGGGVAGGAEEVMKCLDRLYRQRRIELQHVRILRIWGERRVAPNLRFQNEQADARLWREVINKLDAPLRQRGLVV